MDFKINYRDKDGNKEFLLFHLNRERGSNGLRDFLTDFLEIILIKHFVRKEIKRNRNLRKPRNEVSAIAMGFYNFFEEMYRRPEKDISLY